MSHFIQERGRRRAIQAWCDALRKQEEVTAVCGSIAQRNLVQRSFGAWSNNVKRSILNKSTKIRKSTVMRLQAAALRSWIDAYTLESRLSHSFANQRRRRLLAHLRAWNELTRAVGCLKNFHSLNHRRQLEFSWGQWRWKLSNRRKLRCVFTIATLTASRRWERSQLSEFQFLRMVLGSWRECISAKRKRKGCFVLLLGLKIRSLKSAFGIWRDTATSLRVSEFRENAKLSRLMQAYFLEWCVHTVKCRQRALAAIRKASLSKLRKIFKRIQTFIAVEKSRAAHHRCYFLMKSSFEAVLNYRLWTKHDQVRSTLHKRRLRNALEYWERFTILRIRQRRGLDILERCWLRLRLKWALFQWPGRFEFRKAEQMRIRLTKEQKNVCRLVDHKSPSAKVREVPSFIQPRRLSLLEKAIERGFIADRQDRPGILRLFQLLQAVFDGWRIVLHREISLHRRARTVTTRHHRSICRIAWLNWMYLTPRTSHRVIIWTLPRVPLKIPSTKGKEISSIMDIISQNSALSKSCIATISVAEASNPSEELSRC